eukprot:scaffold533739_cov53-Prasinocladus_malaysianus.AAC.1
MADVATKTHECVFTDADLMFIPADPVTAELNETFGELCPPPAMFIRHTCRQKLNADLESAVSLHYRKTSICSQREVVVITVFVRHGS